MVMKQEWVERDDVKFSCDKMDECKEGGDCVFVLEDGNIFACTHLKIKLLK